MTEPRHATTRRTGHRTIAAAAVLTVIGAGTAYSFWTSTGTGTGAATTGTSSAFTVTAAAPVGALAPGSAGQTVEFTVTNTGEGTQYLTAVTVAVAGPGGAAWVPTGGCDPADYSAVISAAPVAGAVLSDGTVVGTATVTLANTGTNQDACQGQTVPLYFEVS